VSTATGGFIVEVLCKEHDSGTFPNQALRLFLPMKTISTLAES